MGLIKKYSKIKPVITEEGMENIRMLLGVSSETGINHYANFIQNKLYKCIRDGELLFHYFPMSKKYKEKRFKSFKNKFQNFEGDIFIPNKNGTKHGTYEVGKKCKEYRLNTDWVEKYVKIKITKERKQRLKRNDGTIKIKKTIHDGVNKSLNKIVSINKDEQVNFDDFVFSEGRIEVEEKLTFISDNHYEININDLKNKQNILLEDNENNFIKVCAKYYGNYIKQKLLKFDENNHSIFRNKYERRLYHTLTHFPKKLYKYIRFNEEYLAEIDLSNSFPLLILTSFLNSQQNKNHFLHEDTDTIDFIEKVKNTESEEYLLASSIWHGNFYEHIFKTVKPNMDESYYTEHRKEFKNRISEILYGKRTYKSSLAKLIESKFPLFMNLIFKYKDNASKSYSEKPKLNISKFIKKEYKKDSNKHKTNFKAGNDSISIFGMIKESLIFIDKVLPLLYNKDYLALSKHDSIILPESKIKEVEYIIRQVLDKEFGQEKYSIKTKIYK